MLASQCSKRCSTWRTLLPILEHRPLAVCDYRTVDPDDLVATDRVYPHKVIELYNLQHNPDQKWYWCSNQKSEEVLLMMMYDTQASGNARCKSLLTGINCKVSADLNEFARTCLFTIH